MNICEIVDVWFYTVDGVNLVINYDTC